MDNENTDTFDVSDYVIVATYLGNPANYGYVIIVPYDIIVGCDRYNEDHKISVATETYALINDYSGPKAYYDPNTKLISSNDWLVLLLAK